MTNSGQQPQDPTQIRVNIDDLFRWLEQQPELEHLREQAASSKCEYRPGLATSAQRIVLNDSPSLGRQKRGPLRSMLDNIWVPGSSLRGDAFATADLDRSLSNTAKIMSGSTIWDFIATIPIFQFSLSSSPIGAVALPAAIVSSFLILLLTNWTGSHSTNRRPGHAGLASWGLVAFVLLSAVKTAFSGVGIDLWLGSSEIATAYAKQLAAEKLESDKRELSRLQQGGPDLKQAADQCARLEADMTALAPNRAANDTQYVSLFVQAYGSNAVNVADRSLTNQQLIAKYGSVTRIPGVCKRRDVLQALNLERTKSLQEGIERRAPLVGNLSLTTFQREEPDLFNQHFRYNGRGEIQWVNGTEAVGQATNQFYSKLFRGQLGLLSFSLMVLSVSIVLTAAASIMLFLTSRNPKVLASYTEELKQHRDRRLDDYEEAVVARSQTEA